MTTDRFDVVIYCIADRRVDTVVGKNLEYHRDRHGESATRRLGTVLPRLNERYDAAIVPAGKYPEGSVLTEDDLACNDWSDTKAQMEADA